LTKSLANIFWLKITQSQYDICIAPLTVLDSGAEWNKMT